MPKDHIAAYKSMVAYRSNEEIANCAHDVLTRMDIPMHYQTLSRIIARDMDKDLDLWQRTPEGISFEAKVLRALNTHPMWFKRVKPGVYVIGRQPGW